MNTLIEMGYIVDETRGWLHIGSWIEASDFQRCTNFMFDALTTPNGVDFVPCS